MIAKEEISVCWFRRDLRLDDNAALFHALSGNYKVLPVFVFDKQILAMFEKPQNAQVEFIHKTILELNAQLQKLKSSILVAHSTPIEFFNDISNRYTIKTVYANEDYELSSIQRDNAVKQLLNEKGIEFHTYKDHVILAKDELLKDDGFPYTVFTPYSKKWKQKFSDSHTQPFNCNRFASNYLKVTNEAIPTLSNLGYGSRGIEFPPSDVTDDLITNYAANRDYPAMRGTSRLGIHLRFGTISIRQLVRRAITLNDTFLNELIWRDFYHSITYHFPRVCQGQSFKAKYDNIVWQNNEVLFAQWCDGQTGYPFVDVGMRELNATGFMHNRVRMIVASFLVKHLLIDWRWGEAYFANKLLDFDFAANNGGWQWAAGCGCDAAPYFRVFNPSLQADKFDKQLEYIRKWIPEIGTDSYCKPIVEHDFARKRAIETYKRYL